MNNSDRMWNYSKQDSLRVGKNGKWGLHTHERNDFTPKQRRRLLKKSDESSRYIYL